MAVSNAFEELSAVLARLEANDADVRAVSVGEPAIESGGDVTAELTVAVPLFAASTIRDGVSIDAQNADVHNQRIALDLTVTVPVTDESPQNAVEGLLDESNSPARSDGTPAYKDPDALATAYAEYDTFPEMTAALDVDVTSETVRRHAIKYGIHNPGDSTPQPGRDLVERAKQNTDSETGDSAAQTGLDTGTGVSAAGGPDSVDDHTASRDDDDDENAWSQTEGSNGPDRDGPASEIRQSERGSGDGAATDREMDDAAVSELSDQSIAELLSKTSDRERETTVVTDGLGVSSELTVGDITMAVNRSRTVQEAKHHLEMSRDNARQLLEQLDLIQFVVNPLATDQIEISPREVVRRIDPEQV